MTSFSDTQNCGYASDFHDIGIKRLANKNVSPYFASLSLTTPGGAFQSRSGDACTLQLHSATTRHPLNAMLIPFDHHTSHNLSLYIALVSWVSLLDLRHVVPPTAYDVPFYGPGSNRSNHKS